jgi:hypothetical protein
MRRTRNMSMRDPRIPKGEPQTWPGGGVSPRVEQRTQMRTLWIELPCPSCRVGKLVATDEVREAGTLHACSNTDGCRDRWVIPGPAYPRRVEEIDPTANLLRG